MTPTAENDAAFDRLSVPLFIRPALMQLLAKAWDKGYTQGYENGALQVRAGSGANPYRVIPPGLTEGD